MINLYKKFNFIFLSISIYVLFINTALSFTEDLIREIKLSEGFTSKPIYDPTGNVVIGYGHTKYMGKYPNFINEKEADKLLRKDLKIIANQLEPVLPENLNLYQKEAVYSIVYNVGIGTFLKTKLYKHLTDDNIEKYFKSLVYGKRKYFKGLEVRRIREYKLWCRK